MAEPLLRNESRAEPAPLAHAETAGFNAIDDNDGIGRRIRPLAGERIEQLGLAVSGHAGDRDKLACPHLQRDILQRHGKRSVGRLVQMIEDAA